LIILATIPDQYNVCHTEQQKYLRVVTLKYQLADTQTNKRARPPHVRIDTTCEGVETAHHLFLSCSFFASLWCLVRNWVGTSSADPFHIQDHFVQLIYLAGGCRARRSFIQLLWFCCIWVVWQERNSRIFKANESTVFHCFREGHHILYILLPS
jgi:hypothetical protein